jgi:hypothetical protein
MDGGEVTNQLSVYSVFVSREDDLWVAVVENLPAGATDVERFEELPEAVSDLISTLLDVEPNTFWIDWHYRLGEHDLTSLIGNLREWEDLAERAARNRDASRRAAMTSMRSAGLSYREIADVIGISHQRVGQLLSESGQHIDVQFPTAISVVHEKWTRHVRNTALHGQAAEAQPTPFEGVLIALLDSVLRARPDSRHSLLSTTAAVLEAAATDTDFLCSH